MKSFLIVNHPVPSVGLGGKVEDSLLAIKKVTNTSRSRALGGSENLEVPVLFGGDNLPPLVEIGLSDLPKSGGAMAPPPPSGTTGLLSSELFLYYWQEIMQWPHLGPDPSNTTGSTSPDL